MLINAIAVVTTHFSDSLDYANYNKWSKADGWSNGGMFNCTWRNSNVWFRDGVMDLAIQRDNRGGFTGGEY